MDFSSHSLLSGAAIQALGTVDNTSLTPALNALLEQHSGMGSAVNSEAFSHAYGALQELSQQGKLGESLATVFDSGSGLAGMVDWVEAIAGQDLDQLVPAEAGAVDLLNPVNGVYGQLNHLVQSWGELATKIDSLTGGLSGSLSGSLWSELAPLQTVTAIAETSRLIAQVGELMKDIDPNGAGLTGQQPEPVSFMRLSGEQDAGPRQADLQVSDVEVMSTAIAPGESLTVAANFHNLGSQTAGNSKIRYWLSNDAVLDNTDLAIGTAGLDALAPGSQTRQAVRFNHQPAWGAGNKYVLVEADGDNGVAERSEANNLSHGGAVQLEQADLQQYWFYYSFNPANPESADSYIGSVIAPEGTYSIAPSLTGGGHDPSYGFNPSTQLTEANVDGKYLVYGKSDYDDNLVADQGKVFVLSYTDRLGESSIRVTPNQYAQGGKPSGLNFLGSESDYLGNGQAAARFGMDYYEADTGNPDIDIQASTPFGYFSAAQRSAIDTAISNWEQLIVSDKDASGVLKLAFTHSAQRLDGEKWGWVWGEAYLDQVVGQRVNRDYAVVDIAGDVHNRVNYNSVKLGQLSSNQLIRLTMHEIGHALGLDEAQEDALLGMDSVMDKHGLDPKVTEGIFQRLESLGYEVNRAAAAGLNWDLSA